MKVATWIGFVVVVVFFVLVANEIAVRSGFMAVGKTADLFTVPRANA